MSINSYSKLQTSSSYALFICSILQTSSLPQHSASQHKCSLSQHMSHFTEPQLNLYNFICTAKLSINHCPYGPPLQHSIRFISSFVFFINGNGLPGACEPPLNMRLMSGCMLPLQSFVCSNPRQQSGLNVLSWTKFCSANHLSSPVFPASITNIYTLKLFPSQSRPVPNHILRLTRHY